MFPYLKGNGMRPLSQMINGNDWWAPLMGVKYIVSLLSKTGQ